MTPQLEFSFRLQIQVAPPNVISNDKHYGKRQLIPIISGTVTGALSGTVLPGGVDSQIIEPDGLCRLSARYAIQTTEGETVYVENNGIRRIPEQWRDQLFSDDMAFFNEIPSHEIYFRSTPTFEIYSDRLRWLKENLFVCHANRTQTGVFIDVYLVK